MEHTCSGKNKAVRCKFVLMADPLDQKFKRILQSSVLSKYFQSESGTSCHKCIEEYDKVPFAGLNFFNLWGSKQLVSKPVICLSSFSNGRLCWQEEAELLLKTSFMSVSLASSGKDATPMTFVLHRQRAVIIK